MRQEGGRNPAAWSRERERVCVVEALKKLGSG